jgi:hypothetical protein
LKVYSYKWYATNCQYDSEIGDGSIVYSFTGLVPEKIAIKDLSAAAEIFRKYLSDDQYFNKKSFVTAYCENEFRPKFPSQLKHLKGLSSGAGGASPQRGTAQPGSGIAEHDAFSDT